MNKLILEKVFISKLKCECQVSGATVCWHANLKLIQRTDFKFLAMKAETLNCTGEAAVVADWGALKLFESRKLVAVEVKKFIRYSESHYLCATECLHKEKLQLLDWF